MSVNTTLTDVKKISSIYIEPDGIELFDIMSMSQTNELFDTGYFTTKKILSDNQDFMKSYSTVNSISQGAY
jgi:hypothetical protein